MVRARPSLRGRSARVRQSPMVPDRADWVLPSELVGAHGSSPSGMRRDGGHALLVGDDRFGPGPILWRRRPPNLGPDDYFRVPWWSSCFTPAWPCPTISLARLMAVAPNGWHHKSLSDDRMLPRGQRGTLPAPGRLAAAGHSRLHFVPVEVFKRGFAELERPHHVEYLQLDESLPAQPPTESGRSIREYLGTPEKITRGRRRRSPCRARRAGHRRGGLLRARRAGRQARRKPTKGLESWTLSIWRGSRVVTSG